VDAVLAGKLFVGNRFSGQDLVGTTDARIPDSKVTTSSPWLHSRSAHEVLFYSDQLSFVEILTQFLGSALAAGDAAVVIVTNSKREVLVHRFQEMGFDVPALIEEG
jgi:hypothetical protein